MDAVSKAQQGTGHRANQTSFKPGCPNRFPPGISGNPSGRPKDAPFTKLCKKLMRSKVGKDLVKSVMNDVLGKRGMASVLLLREIAERTDGKVLQEIAVNEGISTLTDSQLIERLAKLDSEISKRCETLNEQPATAAIEQS